MSNASKQANVSAGIIYDYVIPGMGVIGQEHPAERDNVISEKMKRLRNLQGVKNDE